MFKRRSSDDTDIEAAKELYSDWRANPLETIALLVASTPSPTVTLAGVMSVLLREGVLSSEHLASLGLDEREIGGIISSFENASSFEEAELGLSVAAAVRTFDSQIDSIIREARLDLDDRTRRIFRSTLAKYASDNSITDLKAAYRLACAEGVDLLPLP